ncbi:hypothetical protein AC1031_014127 [Aphanomyces cochlioides]|nr:hypothetical protein AC1031_014127 [Aphanomyces cochlioides]
MAVGNARQLAPSDIWPLANEYDSGVLIDQLEPHFGQSKSLWRSALALFGSPLIVIGGVELVSMLCSFGGPIVLEMVVSAMETHSSSSWTTLAMPVCILFLLKVAQALLQLQADQRTQLVGVQLCSSFQTLIYRKAMRLSPFALALLLFLLWRVLDMAMVGGILVILGSFYINKLLATYDGDADRLVMERDRCTDDVVHAVFSSMQLVKLHAWEERYFATLQQLRADELQSLWSAAMIHVAMVGHELRRAGAFDHGFLCNLCVGAAQTIDCC